MKSKFVLALLLVCVLLVSASCSESSKIENTKTAADVALMASDDTSEDIDALFEQRVSGPELPPDTKPDEEICTDYTNIGLLRICYLSNDTDAKIKLQVLKDGNTIAYNLKGDGSVEDFSLQYGNGEYTARIMQNVKDDEYFVVTSKTFEVALTDETSVYLNSIQNVPWNYNMKPIQDVRYIVSDSLSGLEDAKLLSGCSSDLYEYVIENIKYDSNKVYTLMYDYLPDIEKTYLEGTGICYDYAALFGAMLRSIGIPAKLVKGYNLDNPDVYHAWNEVYIDGEWLLIDTTFDAAQHNDGSTMVKKSERLCGSIRILDLP